LQFPWGPGNTFAPETKNQALASAKGGKMGRKEVRADKAMGKNR